MTKFIVDEEIGDNDTLAEVTNYMVEHSLRMYAKSFLIVAESSCDHVLKFPASADEHFPAILYCVRHAVELFIKYMVLELNIMHLGADIKLKEDRYSAKIIDEHGQRVDFKMWGHGVAKLWKEHRPTIKSCLDHEANAFGTRGLRLDEWLAEFDSIVSEVSAIDPDGCSLRYPTGKDGKYNNGSKYQVSVNQVKEFIIAVRNSFTQYHCRET